MVFCNAFGCNNFNEKGQKCEVSFHRFPSDPVLRRRWVQALRLTNLPPNYERTGRVCSAHFTQEDYVRDLRAELCDQPRRRQLKPEAVPSVFVFTPEPAAKRVRRAAAGRLERNRILSASLKEEESSNPHQAGSSSARSPVESLPDTECDIDIVGGVPPGNESVGVQVCDPYAEQVCLRCAAGLSATTSDVAVQTNEGTIVDREAAADFDSAHLRCSTPDGDSPDYERACLDLSSDFSANAAGSPASAGQSEYDPSETPPESDDDANGDRASSVVNERKFIVFESSLDRLLSRCPTCGAACLVHEKSCVGSMLVVNMTCADGHNCTWESQPIGRHRLPLGNILLAAAVLFCGGVFKKVQDIFSLLNLTLFSKTTFYQVQDTLLLPVIKAAWLREKERVQRLIGRRKKITLCGDGRCDSPGYSAKYGTYTMMEQQSKLVLDFEVVQCTETTSSMAMEKTGFARVMSRVSSHFKVCTVVTDRSQQIAALLRTSPYSKIDHQYDVWHFTKSIAKKIRKVAKKKANAILLEWLPAIANHVWWCARSCKGDKVMLREMWTSVLHHIVNRHSWAGALKFRRCRHPRLTRAQQRKKKWLAVDSPAFQALSDIVNDKKILKDIEQLSKFCHTGHLEVFHNVITKYCPKREHFSHASMIGRTQLAALDNNANVGREQARTEDGKLRFRTEYTRQKGAWVAKKIYSEKDYSFVKRLMCDAAVAAVVSDLSLPDVHLVSLPPNLTGEKAPKKDDLVKALRSRLG